MKNFTPLALVAVFVVSMLSSCNDMGPIRMPCTITPSKEVYDSREPGSEVSLDIRLSNKEPQDTISFSVLDVSTSKYLPYKVMKVSDGSLKLNIDNEYALANAVLPSSQRLKNLTIRAQIGESGEYPGCANGFKIKY